MGDGYKGDEVYSKWTAVAWYALMWMHGLKVTLNVGYWIPWSAASFLTNERIVEMNDLCTVYDTGYKN